MSEKLRIVWEGSFFTSIDNSLAQVNRNIAERLIDKNQFEISLAPLYKDEFEVVKSLPKENLLATLVGGLTGGGHHLLILQQMVNGLFFNRGNLEA